MQPEDAEDVRRLLEYEEGTAGSLMTPVPIILPPEATVAEALAHIRQEELSPAVAAAVIVSRPPLETPTGKYLGMVHTQKLLRYPPPEAVGNLIDRSFEPVSDLGDQERDFLRDYFLRYADASPIHTPGVSCSSPRGSATDVAGSEPIRAEPM